RETTYGCRPFRRSPRHGLSRAFADLLRLSQGHGGPDRRGGAAAPVHAVLSGTLVGSTFLVFQWRGSARHVVGKASWSRSPSLPRDRVSLAWRCRRRP